MPELIAFAGQIRMMVAPVDMRRGIDGLSILVQQVLGFVVLNRRNRSGNG
ncbi:hypothetical protein [Nitrosomonas sp.]|nr:hypothetical protein [Nitrosomonas sp.]